MQALILALVLFGGLRYPCQAMNVRGERILIFGDSLTQHSSGAQPIWNVDQGSQRQSSGPGDLLASLLLEQGATVRTNALVSRSAINFWTREAAQNLIAADLAWRPTKIVFVLGTNDVGLPPGADEAAFVRLRDAYAPAKAEIWAIGPFKSRLAPAAIDGTAAIMARVFGRRFIDGRRLSAIISNGPDGVHYEPAGARLLALNMADALLSASTIKPWMGLAIGMAIVIGGGLAYSAWSRHSSLQGLGAEYLPPGGYFHVDRAARAVPASERFGRRKVFISDVHEQLARAGIDISLADLKRELVRMHHDQNVRLARADLVATMDQRKVAASEAQDGLATFHFVVIE